MARKRRKPVQVQDHGHGETDPLALLPAPSRSRTQPGQVRGQQDEVPPSDEDELEAWNVLKQGDGYWKAFERIQVIEPAVAVFEAVCARDLSPDGRGQGDLQAPVQVSQDPLATTQIHQDAASRLETSPRAVLSSPKADSQGLQHDRDRSHVTPETEPMVHELDGVFRAVDEDDTGPMDSAGALGVMPERMGPPSPVVLSPLDIPQLVIEPHVPEQHPLSTRTPGLGAPIVPEHPAFELGDDTRPSAAPSVVSERNETGVVPADITELPNGSPPLDTVDTSILAGTPHLPPTQTGMPVPASPRRSSPPSRIPQYSPSLTPLSPSPLPNAELQDFISKRTIPRLRNRTAVQLHPYQMERAHYLTVIRQGRRPVEEEMSLRAEKRARERAENYGEGDDTLPSPPATEQSRQTALTPDENDKLDYFSKFGTSFDPADSRAVERMTTITLERVKEAEEERRRKKEIKRGRREFERLLRDRERAADENQAEDAADSAPVVAKKRKRVVNTADGARQQLETPTSARGKARTYARKDRLRIASPSDALSLDDATGRNQSSRAQSHSPISLSQDGDYDDGPSDNYAFDSVHDIPGVRNVARVQSVSSSSSSSDSGEPSAFISKKRIAGRMLPAAMLKRLEAEAARREAKNQARRERHARAGTSASPVRPGKAVVRKSKTRGARVAVDDAMDFLVDPDQSLSEGEQNGLSFYLAEQAKERAKEMPIVIFSDEDDELLESTSSEAYEDNAIHQQDRMLNEGDFESLVNGAEQPRPRPRQRFGPVPRRRPAIGLVGAAAQKSTPVRHRHRPLKQSRLDFERINVFHDSTKQDRAKRDRRRGMPNPKPPRRPAIYLDDETIFASEDFAFDPSPPLVEELSDSPSVISVHSATSHGRSKSRSHSRPPAAKRTKTSETPGRRGRGTRNAFDGKVKDVIPRPLAAFDANVGKIRSWLNLGPCDPDFGLQPLPATTTFAEGSMLTDGRVRNLLAYLRNEPVDVKISETVSAFGFVLERTSTAAALCELIEPLFTAEHELILAMANNRMEPTPEHLFPIDSVLSFFRDYVLFANSCGNSPTEEQEALRHTLSVASAKLTESLADIPMPRAKGDRTLPNLMLRARWMLIEILAVCEDSRPAVKITTALHALAATLLDYGFNASMKSVKVALALSPERPVLSDISVDIWVALRSLCQLLDQIPGNKSPASIPVCDSPTFAAVIDSAVARTVAANPSGPEAAERLWYLIFGLSVLAQITPDGKIDEAVALPMWQLVKRAVNLVTIINDEDIEAEALSEQIRNRDAYVRVMLTRTLQLVSTWRWEFSDRDSVATATRHLGLIFKARNHRNLPSERPADFPQYISNFDMSLTAQLPVEEGSSYDLYLRLVCISASDLLSFANTMEAALQAERDVQRLIQPIFPVSPFPFTKAKPPSPRQLSALTNRYSTLVVACYFSPPLLGWLLANTQNWLDFSNADFNSRRQSIRGMMYLAVACRHHELDVKPVVDRLLEMLDCLLLQLQSNRVSGVPAVKAKTRMAIERTMILLVTAFRQVIVKHSFDVERQATSQYPDPILLGWADRILSSDLILDRVYGREIISCIQCYLDARNAALPASARQARAAKASAGSQDEYPSLGFDFSEGDFAVLCDDPVTAPTDFRNQQDLAFARIIESTVSPGIYHILSTLLTTTGELSPTLKPDLQLYLQQLTKCWVDCVSVVVIEHQLQDWSTYVGYGKQSWGRLRDETGRRQVGVTFMHNVAQIDPGSFQSLGEYFVSLIFQSLVIEDSLLSIEPQFFSSVLNMPGASEHPLLFGLVPPGPEDQAFWALDRESFLLHRSSFLQTIFSNIPTILLSKTLPQTHKPFVYQTINVIIGLMLHTYQSIATSNNSVRVRYCDFCNATISDLRRLTGEFIQASSVPDLKHFPLQ